MSTKSQKFTICFGLLTYQVLLHEGGTLLVCLNSIRALNNPTWSWVEDLQQLVAGVTKAVADFLKKRPPPNCVAEAIPL